METNSQGMLNIGCANYRTRPVPFESLFDGEKNDMEILFPCGLLRVNDGREVFQYRPDVAWRFYRSFFVTSHGISKFFVVIFRNIQYNGEKNKFR